MRRYLIVLLTLITAVIHIYFFFLYNAGNALTLTGPNALFTFFLLNAIGYLGLLGLLYLPLGLPAGLHRLIRYVFIGFTILTFVLYFYFSAKSGEWSVPLAPIAKVDELILIWQLWAEGKAMSVSKQPA
jgi:hypothetical protein